MYFFLLWLNNETFPIFSLATTSPRCDERVENESGKFLHLKRKRQHVSGKINVRNENENLSSGCT